MAEVVVTRVQRNGPPRRSRNLDERLMVRFPAAYRALARLSFSRLSPRSRLRRAFLRWALLAGWASFDRRDFELNLILCAPDVEFDFPSGMKTLGLTGSFPGWEGRIKALNEIAEIWGATELEPVCIVDLGDRVLPLGFWRAQASVSGVRLEQEFAQVLTLRDGLVTRDEGFFSWDEALRAAGLDPDALPLPSRDPAARAPHTGEGGTPGPR